MKQKSILFFLVCFISVSGVTGKECNLEIREGLAAKDLSKVLHCLQKQNEKNRMEILDLKRRVLGGGKYVDPSRFHTGRIEIIGRGASRQNKCINLGLSIKNTTTEKIFIATERSKSALIDELTGISFPIREQSGLNYVTGRDNESRNESSYTPLLPNSHLNFSM